MIDLLPVFSTHYSQDAILTLEEAGSTEPGNPVSVVDLARAHHLKQVVVVDQRIDGFIQAHKSFSKPFKPTPPKPLAEYVRAEQGDKKSANEADRAAGQAAFDAATAKYDAESKWSTEPIQLIYGLKLCVCADMTVKDEPSRRGESNVIIFVRNTQGYSDLLRIWSRAWTDGFYHHGRIDWRNLKELWTGNLSLALPFFSSFLAQNLLTFASIVPDLPVPANEVTLFREIGSELAFESLIDEVVVRFAADTGAPIQPTKSIYYADAAAFDTYVTYRAIHERGEFSAPGVSHLSSDTFSFAEWQRLTKETTT